MKKIGLCSLALAGVLALSGCQSGKKTNEKIDEIVQKMDEQEVADFDYAKGLFSLAGYYYYTNHEGYRDNLIITTTLTSGSSEQEKKDYFYKDDSNKYHFVTVENDGETRVIYEDGDEVYDVTKNSAGEITKEKTELDSTEIALNYVEGETLEWLFPGQKFLETLSKVEKLENGNIALTFVSVEEGYAYNAVVEITTDAKVVSITHNSVNFRSSEQKIITRVQKKSFTYGNANDTSFQEKLAWAKAQSLSK